jgi:hypothetical protein
LKQVEDKAREWAESTVSRSTVFRSLYGEVSLGGRTQAYLRIINPNPSFMTAANIEQTVDETVASGKARLAWVFWYAWTKNDGVPPRGVVAVYLDAFTGEYLGGDGGAL